MRTCVMLDVDGVLVDGRPSDGQPWTHTLEQDLGISPQTLIGAFFRSHWSQVVTGQRDLLPTLSAVLAQCAPQVRAEDLVTYWFEQDSRIVAPVLSDLRAARLAGVSVYLATNQDHMRAEYLMSEMGLGQDVDGIVYSAAVGHRKPDRAFYQSAEQATGYPPEALLLVDDTPANVEAARDAGWRAEHWTGVERLSQILDRVLA